MSTELSVQSQSRGLALKSMDDAMRFASLVAASEFAPKDFRGKPESCLLAIQHGAECGLSPMQSLQSIAVINGRPTIWGDAALALVQSSPVCEYVTEQLEGDGDQLAAVCTAKRRGYPQPTVVRFSMADAKRAGLIGKAGPWAQYPARMLALRARGFALRNAFADCLRGLVTAEEAQDYPPAAATAVASPRSGSGGSFPSGSPAPAEPSDGAQPVPEGDEPARRVGWLERVNKATTVEELGQIGDEADQAESAGELSPTQRQRLDRQIAAKHDQIESKTMEVR